MKILAVGDPQNCFEKFPVADFPHADVCFVAGDITEVGIRADGIEIGRAKVWMKQLSDKYPAVIWIGGNHDCQLVNSTFDDIAHCIGIMDKTIEFNGYRIHGVNLSPCYDLPQLANMWAMTIDPEVERKAFDFERVDIVLSHCPPKGCCDGSGYVLGEGHLHIGSQCLRDYIEKNQPELLVCGHVHGNGGCADSIGRTQVYNVAQTFRLLEI